jgi:hypothetical protein
MSNQQTIIHPLKLKNSTKQYFKKAKLKEAIINEIQSLPEFNKDLKFDNEIIESILQAVETKFYKKNSDEKKEISINILTDLFSLSTDEINIIQKTIAYMYENKIIKKPKVILKYLSIIGGYIFKKV